MHVCPMCVRGQVLRPPSRTAGFRSIGSSPSCASIEGGNAVDHLAHGKCNAFLNSFMSHPEAPIRTLRRRCLSASIDDRRIGKGAENSAWVSLSPDATAFCL